MLFSVESTEPVQARKSLLVVFFKNIFIIHISNITLKQNTVFSCLCKKVYPCQFLASAKKKSACIKFKFTNLKQTQKKMKNYVLMAYCSIDNLKRQLYLKLRCLLQKNSVWLVNYLHNFFHFLTKETYPMEKKIIQKL